MVIRHTESRVTLMLFPSRQERSMSSMSNSERLHSPVKPLDALLASYCVGALDRPTHALVASHLLLNPENRRFVAALEDLAAGEVEQIAMMKPKAASPHEEGLLEYLEDIIGSNRYVEQIDQVS